MKARIMLMQKTLHPLCPKRKTHTTCKRWNAPVTAGTDGFSGDSSIGHETWPEYLTSTGSRYLFLVLFWTNGMSVIWSFHTEWVIGESNGASARKLLQPLCTKDGSES
jgi:hypothetical protein